ncbi:mitochondrial import receptor subunit Tom22-domain-containing protein [Gaertneriomyces semiglobifer]|nr:mitochondrial import receptor subunit Tom22-domain-containing protein [Gaertneriomyces semiglobifer]
MVELTEVSVTETVVLKEGPASDDPLISALNDLQEDDDDSDYVDEPHDESSDDESIPSDQDDLAQELEDLADDEEDEYEDETLLERITALADIIPPTTRRKITSSVKGLTSNVWGATKWVGSAAWVVATGAMLVVLPVALELEREQFVFQQEAQMRQQQQQAQQMAGGVPGAAPPKSPAFPQSRLKTLLSCHIAIVYMMHIVR